MEQLRSIKFPFFPLASFFTLGFSDKDRKSSLKISLSAIRKGKLDFHTRKIHERAEEKFGKSSFAGVVNFPRNFQL
jgi:hypothetical protein